MIESLLSRWRQIVASTLIVLTAVVSVAPALHGTGHDADCDPAVFFHDASQHRMGSAPAAGQDAPGDHCVACHLFRSTRTASSGRFVPQTLDDGVQVRWSNPDLFTTALAVRLPARAPPVQI